MININDVSLLLGSKLLFENVNITLFDQQKIALVGPNGSGKSSFFKLLLGEHQPDGGQIHIPKNLRLAHSMQDVPPLPQTALDFVLDGDKPLRAIENALNQAELNQDEQQIALLHEKFAAIDAYSAPARAAKLLDGLGFNTAAQQKPVKDFSGGWRTRLSLAQTLMCPADMLLLDEPTNHLDLDAIVWLEKWLQKFAGALLIISHDRVFLDNCVDKVIHIENQQLKVYQGNYSAFEKIHAEQLALQQKMHEKQQRQIEHMMSFVNRFKAKASKAKQAQSRLKAIQKLDLIAAAQVDSPFDFEFPQTEPPPNPLLTLTDVYAGYSAEKPILQKVNLQIYPGMRMGLLGANGAGKSTLMKTLSGKLTPLKGTCYIASKVKMGYYAQHQIEQLNFSQTPLWHLQQLAPRESPSRLRQFLGGFGFSGDMALSVITHFSGGEKARLALALLVWEAPNLLLLDEPTNHLDLEMRNALNLALQSFQGALVLVSHDRYLLQTATDELFLISDHAFNPFTGDLNDYQKWLLSSREAPPVSLEKKFKSNADKRRLQDQIEKLEKQLQKLQTEKLQIEQALSDNHLYQPDQKNQLAQLLQKQTQVKKKISETEALWLKISEELHDNHSV